MSSYQYPPVPIDSGNFISPVLYLTVLWRDGGCLGTNFTETIHHNTYPAIDSANADLTGKIIYITGASRGVGYETAISCAKAGAKGIALGARSDFTTIETEIHSAALAAGKNAPKVLKLKVDVANQANVDSVANEIEKVFGRLDILINNAGFLSEFNPLVETDPVAWWTNWEVNIKGVYLVTRSLLPLMLKGGEKTIVNISSIGGLALAPGASGYQPSKFALLRFTEFICTDYAKQGVLAYCIHPGGVKTELSLKMPVARQAREYSWP